jgi:hypothetical protein
MGMMLLVLIRRHRVLIALGSLLIAVACVISSKTGGTNQQTSAPVTVRTAMKVHMLDGSIIVLANGGAIDRNDIVGTGMRYDPTLRNATASGGPIPLDSVVGVETYERTVNPGRTLLYSAATTFVTLVGSAAAAIAIFGSCPTIYADSAGTPVLLAESFSYSIAPLLEKRDVDRLRFVDDGSGVVRLDIRNEALETHYIDHLELLEARHLPDELVLPAARAGLIAVRNALPATSVHDRAGRDLRQLLAAADDHAFATDSATLHRASLGGDADDEIDVTVPKPRGIDSVAIVLRARSSLLTTMLFYDQMLAGQGASALDYVGYDLGRVTKVAQLANWFVRNLGVRVSVLTNGGRDARQIVRLVDFGPAAWRDIAVIVPAERDADSVHVRLSFLADEIRIDQLLVSFDMRLIQPRTVPIARVVGADGDARPDVRDALRSADDNRLQTWPGQHFTAEFDVGQAPRNQRRTYFLAAQGYYVEWMRGNWLTRDQSSARFEPWKAPLAPILQHWLQARDSLDKTFFTKRVPIV